MHSYTHKRMYTHRTDNHVDRLPSILIRRQHLHTHTHTHIRTRIRTRIHTALTIIPIACPLYSLAGSCLATNESRVIKCSSSNSAFTNAFTIFARLWDENCEGGSDIAAVDMRSNTGWCDALSLAKAFRRLETPCAEKSCIGSVSDVSPRKLNNPGSRSSACVCIVCVYLCVYLCVCVCVCLCICVFVCVCVYA